MVDSSKLKNYAATLKQGKKKTIDRNITARVAGVTFEGRQELISKMTVDTPVKLERDRRNEYDSYAVKVMALIEDSWQSVGFVPKKMSRTISFSLDNGVTLVASVKNVKGGMVNQETGEKFNYGLDISITPELAL